jgi:hypothetical protein
VPRRSAAAPRWLGALAGLALLRRRRRH